MRSEREFFTGIFKRSFAEISDLGSGCNTNIDLWIKNKEDCYSEINQQVFKLVNLENFYLRNIDKKESKCYALEAYYWLYRRHLSSRLKIQNALRSTFLYYRIIFIAVSHLDIFIFLMQRLAKGIVKSFNKYDIAIKDTETILTINFPSHAFNVRYERNHLTQIPESFGEYYLSYHRNNAEKLVSIDEYLRPSKFLEKSTSQYEGQAYISLSRQFIKSNFHPFCIAKNITSLFYQFKEFLKETGSNRNGKRIFLYYVGDLLIAKPLLDLLDRNKEKITKIYLLPFSDKAIIKLHVNLREKTITYNYAQNYCEYPSRQGYKLKKGQKLDIQKEMKMLSPGIWTVSGGCIGFTDIYSYAQLLRELFFSNNLHESAHYEIESPVLLGYESNYNIKININEPIAMIFDIPPISEKEIYTNHICGDLLPKLENTKKWMEDVVDALINNGYVVYLKPKYSLSNYSESYGNFLKLLAQKWTGKFIILNPYCSIINLLSNATISICMPYTSIKYISDACGSKGIFYLPDSFNAKVILEYENNDVIFGKDRLIQYLLSLRNNKFMRSST